MARKKIPEVCRYCDRDISRERTPGRLSSLYVDG